MHDYKKLEVWKRSIQFAESCYGITSTFPDHERFGLISQIRRAATSIPSNLAEGAGRNTGKDFAHFLSICQGSSFELETQLILSEKLGFIDSDKSNLLIQELNEISKMIFSLRNKILNE